ncbi:uncharacterized protein LOC129456236 isoform X2 [Periophthalmus magnuspinnatus]|uniref:uncharacterized protein LOC129456236 isoform X2 n=1 Tax=Periophthalmus magnuspinnatus TaxID=409849 RepID=UPI0024369558|nr:uncharacterized protein LOC129456236 isoform X2 [Periophthalmus magnuspinnatus]
MVKPGDNITLLCDCTCSTGVYTVWYRNCSHTNQPTLVLKTWKDSFSEDDQNEILKLMNPLPRFKFVKDSRSKCYNLHITNITENDGGSYYCGTQTTKVLDSDKIKFEFVYNYGNTTRILFKLSEPLKPECGQCWILLFSVCPALSLLSIVLLVFVIYSECFKQDVKRAETRVQMSQSEDGDVCYAALEIRQKSQRPKRKKNTPDSDFCTYSAIKTSQE